MSVTYAPQGVVTLCHVPFESDGLHNVYFKPTQNKTSLQLRDEWLQSLDEQVLLGNYSYTRKDSAIKVDINYEIAKKYNYCYYRNYKTSRMIYCYIIGMEYVNENCTKCIIRTDNWQTWFDEILKDDYSISYIERMHLSKAEDVIGASLVPEGLEHGDLVVNDVLATSTINNSSIAWTNGGDPETTGTSALDLRGVIMVGVSEQIGTIAGYANTRNIGMSYSGLSYVGFATTAAATAYLNYADSLSKGDAIYTIFMVPGTICGTAKWLKQDWTYAGANYEAFMLQSVSAAQKLDTLNCNSANITSFKNTKDDTTYTPNNKKLLYGDYNYLMLSDNNGHCGTYYYEYFTNKADIKFEIKGVMSQGCSISLIPKNYKGLEDNYNETLSYIKLPTCSWTTDTYTNWLTQTAVSRNTQLNYIEDKYSNISNAKIASMIGGAGSIASSVAQGVALGAMAGSVATPIGTAIGAGVGAVGGLLSWAADYDTRQTNKQKEIDDINNEVYQHSLVPAKASNTSASPDVLYALGKSEFNIYAMQITGEYAKKIDEYFDRYGYKVITNGKIKDCVDTRRLWNYVKAVECNLHCDKIPDENMAEIKKMFENGVTLWHDASNIYRYDLGGTND